MESEGDTSEEFDRGGFRTAYFLKDCLKANLDLLFHTFKGVYNNLSVKNWRLRNKYIWTGTRLCHSLPPTV